MNLLISGGKHVLYIIALFYLQYRLENCKDCILKHIK